MAKDKWRAASSGIGSMQGITLPGSDSKVYRYENPDETVEYDSDEVFSTTCHETAHTSQYWFGPLAYMTMSGIIRESWATAVEWVLTHDEYASRGIANYGDNTYYLAGLSFPNMYAYQSFVADPGQKEYTPLFIDLIDNVNQWQVAYPNSFAGSVQDNVTGYTIGELEDDIIKHVWGLEDLRNKLKEHRPAGVTDNQIDQLLSFYY